MWMIKKFKTEAAQEAWIEKWRGIYQITRLIVNNGYAVEFRKLRMIG